MENKLKVFGYSFILLTWIQVSYGAIIITEVNVHPLDDAYDEYVEIYNDGTEIVDLSNYGIKDLNDCDSFSASNFLLQPKQYAIITDQFSYVFYDYNVSGSALKIRVREGSIGNGLGNNEDTIILYKDNCIEQIDNFTWNYAHEGYSWSLINDSWEEKSVTPGYSNLIQETCDASLKIKLDKFYFENSEAVKFSFDVNNPIDYLIEYWIEDLNSNIVRNRVNTSNSNEKSWSYYTGKGDVFLIRARFVNLSCEDTNLNDNEDSRIVGIKENVTNENSLKIEEIYLGNDKKAKWGDTIRVKVKIYKGNETKDTIYLFLEKEASKKSRIIVYDEFIENNLVVPVQIEPNCDKQFEDGYYDLILEGLDESDKEEIQIEGYVDGICDKSEDREESKENEIQISEKKVSNVLSAGSKNEKAETIIKESCAKQNDIYYESTSIKAKNTGLYFFCVLLVIMIIYSVIENDKIIG